MGDATPELPYKSSVPPRSRSLTPHLFTRESRPKLSTTSENSFWVGFRATLRIGIARQDSFVKSTLAEARRSAALKVVRNI
jgi:hypothetical protein